MYAMSLQMNEREKKKRRVNESLEKKKKFSTRKEYAYGNIHTYVSRAAAAQKK